MFLMRCSVDILKQNLVNKYAWKNCKNAFSSKTAYLVLLVCVNASVEL